MGLQTNQAHINGHEQKLFVMVETTPGTFLKPSATVTAAGSVGIVRHPNCHTTSMVPNVERKDRLDAYMATRDPVERITGKSEHSFSVEMYYCPSGTKDRSPDAFPFIVASGFTETVNANDVTMTQHSNQTVSALSITRHFQELLQEAMAGCVVDTWSLEFAGGEEPMFKASGRAMTYAATGKGSLDAATADPWTTMLLQPDENNLMGTSADASGGAGLGARSIIQINDGSAPATDVEVTVTSAATAAVPSFTITTTTTNQDDDAVVTPYVPTHGNLGSPIAGTSGTLSLDDSGDNATTIRPTAVAINYTNTMTYNDDEAFQPGMTDAIPTIREVNGSITFRVRQDHIEHILNRQEHATRALTLTVGGAAESGTRLVISLPYCEMEYNEISAPQNGEATVSATFKAIGSSGNDVISLVHT